MGGPWIFNFCLWCLLIINIFFVGPSSVSMYRQIIEALCVIWFWEVRMLARANIYLFGFRSFFERAPTFSLPMFFARRSTSNVVKPWGEFDGIHCVFYNSISRLLRKRCFRWCLEVSFGTWCLGPWELNNHMKCWGKIVILILWRADVLKMFSRCAKHMFWNNAY